MQTEVPQFGTHFPFRLDPVQGVGVRGQSKLETLIYKRRREFHARLPDSAGDPVGDFRIGNGNDAKVRVGGPGRSIEDVQSQLKQGGDGAQFQQRLLCAANWAISFARSSREAARTRSARSVKILAIVSARLKPPTFILIRSQYVFTVRRLMPSLLAMPSLVRPWIHRSNTWSSRGDRSGRSSPSAPLAPKGSMATSYQFAKNHY